ncbi:hypothetical protein HELRODRAFT_138686, partial [Helobdella robusta]|uniref:Bromo domain-containing protein n=1 Tax=Helobdella robusta TaxID=6412 RepID=T1EIW4_HELRO
IQDYFDKIKNPMDLSTIEMKLNNRQYTDPWQYINDVYLMFENAWCYNKRTHRVYKYCTKLSEIFDSEIDGPVRSLG